ncbi:tetraspanin-33 isoform X1 [Paroedura picta]|uniref:tetraspanin-33 isoform X1 n=1 Tax=Paroedura picta TaxID=143630 RepID=UPI004055DE61
MAMAKRPAAPQAEDFSFVSPLVKYLLFFFNTGFWMVSMVMVAVGIYARLMKHAEAAMACLAVDPAILLIVVGVLMFFITFCGCIGSLRENICLLQTFSVCLTVIFLLQLVVGVLGFVFSDKARGKVSEIVNNAIVHYRDDLDLQNLIDFGQKELLRRRLLQRLVPKHVFQLHGSQPKPGTLLRALLLLPAGRRPVGHQYHVWPRHAGPQLPGGRRVHLHQRLHRQAGQLDPQQPLPARRGGPRLGHPPADRDRALPGPRQPDQRPDQAAVVQSAAPSGSLVLTRPLRQEPPTCRGTWAFQSAWSSRWEAVLCHVGAGEELICAPSSSKTDIYLFIISKRMGEYRGGARLSTYHSLLLSLG